MVTGNRTFQKRFSGWTFLITPFFYSRMDGWKRNFSKTPVLSRARFKMTGRSITFVSLLIGFFFSSLIACLEIKPPCWMFKLITWVGALLSLLISKASLKRLGGERRQTKGRRFGVRQGRTRAWWGTVAAQVSCYRFQIVITYSFELAKRFENAIVWTRVFLKTETKISVFKRKRIRVNRT